MRKKLLFRLKINGNKTWLMAFFMTIITLNMAIATPSNLPIPVSKKVTVRQIQTYLNGIKTLKANLVQINPDQQQLTGAVYISRISNVEYGKMRIEYTQPGQDLVIADGERLILFNFQAKEKTTYDLSQTPAGFLLQKKIDLDGDFTVKAINELPNSVEVVMTKFGAGEAFVTLKFSTIPMLKFNGWVIVDGQGNRTEVNLQDVLINIDLPDYLFSVN